MSSYIEEYYPDEDLEIDNTPVIKQTAPPPKPINKPNWEEIRQLTTINELADAAHENAKAKGFHDAKENGETVVQFVTTHSNLIHSEVSELFEALRDGTFFMTCDKADKMHELGLPLLTCAEEEYADIVIRVFDQCRRLGIDIQTAIQAKHAYNTTRPHMHGKKF